MRHRRTGRILKREKGPREALLRGLMRSVVLHKGIVTTEAKAKEVRPKLERLVTRAKKGTLADHRFIVAQIGRDAAAIMKKDIMPIVEKRSGGYLRVIKQGPRKSDAARMAFIQFVS